MYEKKNMHSTIIIIGSTMNKSFLQKKFQDIKGTLSQPQYTTPLYSILSNDYLVLLLLDKTLVSPNFQVIKI